MDVSRLVQVLKRNRWITLVGLLVGLALAAVTFHSSKVVYESRSVLFVTQKGFPWGSTLGEAPDARLPASGSTQPTFGAPSRFIELAGLYAGLATSDVIRLRVLGPGETLGGEVFAERLVNSGSQGGDDPLPLVQIESRASSPALAVDITSRFDTALQHYITEEQDRNKIASQQRVVLDRVRIPSLDSVEIARGRGVTRPGAIFLAMLILTLAVAFIRENWRQGRLSGGSGDVGTGPQEHRTEGQHALPQSSPWLGHDAIEDTELTSAERGIGRRARRR